MTVSAKLKDIDRSLEHALSLVENCADRGRQSFLFHAKRQLAGMSRSDLAQIAQVRSGTPNPTRRQCENALNGSPGFAAWSSLNVGSQRQMWLALDHMFERQADDMEQRRRQLEEKPKIGSLELDPACEIPSYLRQTAFHGQPGGYVTNRNDADLRAGALQEVGGALYTRGMGTGLRDSKAQAVVHYLRERFPDLAPRRVLDLGCGHGSQTCGYALAYPEAQTHGIDLGESLLRFAHLKAESLDVGIHLHQRDATDTGFESQSFDLVVSNILLHEVPTEVLRAIMAECYRILAPGGVVIHQDVPTQKSDLTGYNKFMAMWQTQHNDEPYWEAFANTHVPDELERSGFERQQVFEDYVPQVAGPLDWYFVGATKA